MTAAGGLSATEMLRQMDRGETSARELAAALIEREEAARDFNAVSHFDPDLLLRTAEHRDAARARGEAGPLCGVPIIAKDNFNTVAFPTTGGTHTLLNNTPATNAGVITQFEKAGGIIGAKAGMHELAFGITSNNAVTGAVRNPHDRDMIPGGSSGGTAAAVASGVFPIGLGTDTGASVRLPAALCGVIGFRPTVGRYPGDGILPISHTRDTPGPIAACMDDITLMDSVMSDGADAPDALNLSDARLGIPQEVFFDDLEPAVEKAVSVALKTLQSAGATLIEVSLADIWPLNEAVGFPVALYEVMRDLPAYLAEHTAGVSLEELVAGIGSPDVAGIIGSQMGTEAMPEAAYRAAMDTYRPAMQAMYHDIFRAHDLTALVFPTAPLRARPIGQDETVELNGAQVPTFPTFIRNTDLVSNIGGPGISLPCPDVTGLPVGIEFDGPIGADETLLALARVAEAVFTR